MGKYAELVAELAAIEDNLERDHAIRDAAKEENLTRAELKQAVETKRREQADDDEPTQAEPDFEELEESAREIIDSRNVLDLFAEDIAGAIAGEKKNVKLLYLIATSRLFDQPMHVAIKGPSGAGKSEERRWVLEFFPPEEVI